MTSPQTLTDDKAKLMAGSSARTGVVQAFDEARGLGEIVDGGTRSSIGFHCTAIADGTRQIEVGAKVVFVARAAQGGKLEASAVIKKDIFD